MKQKTLLLLILLFSFSILTFGQNWKSEKSSLINKEINRLLIKKKEASKQVTEWEQNIEEAKMQSKRHGYPLSLKIDALNSVENFKKQKKNAKQSLANIKISLKRALREERLILKSDDEGEYWKKSNFLYVKK